MMKYFRPIILVSLLLLLCAPLQVSAQQHLKFMGIPLTGSIDNFQRKLAAKGIQPDRELNRMLPFGSRSFKGRFTGKNCTICTYYTDNKTVYRAKAVYSNEDEGLADQFYEEIKELLQTKYPDGLVKNSTYEGYDACSIMALAADGETVLGSIDLYKTRYGRYSFEYNYSIHVDYTDYINSNAKTDEKMDDL